MKKRYGVDTDILMGMEILTQMDNAKAKTDAAQDAIILREIHEMASDPCPKNIEYDAGIGENSTHLIGTTGSVRSPAAPPAVKNIVITTETLNRRDEMNLLCVKNVKELGKVWNGTWENMQLVFQSTTRMVLALMNFRSGFPGPYTLQKILAEGAESPYEIHLHVRQGPTDNSGGQHDNDDSELEYDEVPS